MFRRMAGLSLLLIASVPALGADTASFVASGTGSVVTRPDIVFVDIGFSSEGKTPELAIAADEATVRKVIAALSKAGVEARDLQTANYVIDEIMGPKGCDDRYSNQPIVECKLEGYQIKNSMTVRVRDLPRYGKILGAAIEAGLKDISHITLAVADPKPYEEQAYAAALLDARARAELTAKTLGFKLGAILDVGANFQSPDSHSGPATLAGGLDYDPYAGGEADSNVVSQMQPGELTFSRDASITYEIIQEH